ncbi:hypothetical protein BGZ96_011465 [Linnemannia gamsii]|uniref:Uncharacterized protein n=1 Tax=Linnemannia gamsii TaxID=64522 RepID=A0ABQ7JSJ6_9FUNG|nr:hypothetical protein BGZ96_011465 [Linnemannia gamsii]
MRSFGDCIKDEAKRGFEGKRVQFYGIISDCLISSFTLPITRMKFNNIHLSPWFTHFLLLLIAVGTNSNRLASSAPAQAPPVGPGAFIPTAHIPTVRIHNSVENPSYYSTQVDRPVTTHIVRKGQSEESDDRLSHRLDPVSKCYVNSQRVKICHRTKRNTESVEEDEDSETKSSFRLSKRRLAINYPARWVNPADARKRDIPNTDIASGEESESVEGNF